MIKRLMHAFALTEKGAKDLIKAVFWCFICNISLMLPIISTMFAIRHMITAFSSGEPVLEGILPVIAFSILSILLLYLFHYLQYAFLYIAVYKESANRRTALAETLRKLPLSFFGKRDLSDLTATMISDCSSLDQMFSHYVPQLYGSIFSTLLIAILMFITNWKMAIAVLWIVPATIIIVFGSKRIQDKYGAINIEKKRAVTEQIQQMLEAVKEIKSARLQERELSALDKRQAEQEKAAVRSELATGVFVTGSQALLKLGIATTIITGLKLLSAGSLDLVYFIGFLFAASMIYNPIATILQNIAAVFSTKLQIERMRTILEAKRQEGRKDLTPNGYDIAFHNVSFSYDEGREVLEDVSFTAKQKEVTALIGPSGGGKSTACRLASRFWDIDEGMITLGGMDIAKCDPEKLLTYYSIVFQDVVLFSDTIKENIRLGKKGASDEEVYEAARMANCEEFVRKLPNGYDTVIGENGSTLSAGERQRISIARAILKNAPVVLLDEATANLDVENETQVQQALSYLIKDKTVLIIAHRMRTVRNADKIIVLENGRIKEMGAPDALLEKKGAFFHMMELQERSDGWKA